jgi:DNA-binding transcriptional regulator YiaG
MNTLTQAELFYHLSYNPVTGVFIRHKSNNQHGAGRPSGYNHGRGYIKIEIDSVAYFAHRLAFLYMTGKFPEHQVDHINQIRDDNRWNNLREVSKQEQSRNYPKYKTNTSGHVGVYSYPRDSGVWRAMIGVEGKLKTIGTYKTKEEAITARKQAEIEHGFHDNHGVKESVPRLVRTPKKPTVPLKLSWEQVCEIRAMKGLSQQDIADYYGCSQPVISGILRNKTRLER